jgi:hypothetical protein
VIIDFLAQKTSAKSAVIHSQPMLGWKIFNIIWKFCKTQDIEAEFIIPEIFRGQWAFGSSLQNRSGVSSVGNFMLDNTAYAVVS